MTLILLPEAAQEETDAATFYSSRSPGLGAEFLDELDAAYDVILGASRR